MSLSAKIDKQQLARAMEDGSPDNRYLLDRETGEITLVSAKTMSTDVLMSFKEKMAKDPKRYIPVVKTPSEEKYRDMELFAQQTKDKKLQERLILILRGGNPARPFIDAMDSAQPLEKDSWRKFKTMRILRRIETFMKENGLINPA